MCSIIHPNLLLIVKELNVVREVSVHAIGPGVSNQPEAIKRGSPHVAVSAVDPLRSEPTIPRAHRGDAVGFVVVDTNNRLALLEVALTDDHCVHTSVDLVLEKGSQKLERWGLTNEEERLKKERRRIQGSSPSDEISRGSSPKARLALTLLEDLRVCD